MKTLTVRCGHEQHRLAVDDEGHLILFDHDEADAIVEALGAPRARCRAVAEAWANYRPHDVRAVVALGWPHLLTPRGLADCERATAGMAQLHSGGSRLPADARRWLVLRSEPEGGRAWAEQWAERWRPEDVPAGRDGEIELAAGNWLMYKLSATTAPSQ